MDTASTISELYRVFQPYRLGPDFSGCDCCVDPRQTEFLAKTPLRELTAKELDHFAFNAMTTWGDVRHFKHFLPRLLELAAEESEGFTSLEILFSKLSYGEWETWPAWEREAVHGYFRLAWDHALSSDLSWEQDQGIDTLLCSLGLVYSTIASFLQHWRSLSRREARRQLANFVLLNVDSLERRARLANTFWSEREAQAAEVIQWLKHGDTYEYLLAGQKDLDEQLMKAIPALEKMAAG